MTESGHDGLPRDRGWAWMCMLGVLLCMFFVVGTFKSLGILFDELLDVYEQSRGLTVWVVGLITCCMSLGAPIANTLASRYSIRVMVMTGSLLGSTGAFLCAFAPNIYFIIIVFGVFTGLGFACLMGTSMMAIGLYFEQRRSFANGIAMSGASLGQLVIPPIMTALIDHYTFRGALIIYAGLHLNTLVAAMLIRPTAFYLKKKPAMICLEVIDAEPVIPQKMQVNCDNENVPSCKKRVRDAGDAPTSAVYIPDPLKKTSSKAAAGVDSNTPLLRGNSSMPNLTHGNSEDRMISKGSQERLAHQKALIKHKKQAATNKLQEGAFKPGLQKNFSVDSCDTQDQKGILSQTNNVFSYIRNFMWGGQARAADTPGCELTATAASEKPSKGNLATEDSLSDDNFFSLPGDMVAYDPNVLSLKGSESGNTKFFSCNSFQDAQASTPNQNEDMTKFKAKLDQKASAGLLEVLADDKQVVETYESEVLQNGSGSPTVQVIQPESESETSSSCWSNLNPCQFYSWSLFRNSLFLIYMFACVLGNSAYVDHFIFLPPFGGEVGFRPSQTAHLLMVAAICDLCGRMFGGWFSDLNFIKRSTTMSAAMMATGVSSTICALVASKSALWGLSVVLGFVGGIYASLYGVVLIDFLGVARFPAAFGLMVMCQGLFNTLLLSLLGSVSDLRGNFDICFFIVGPMMILSGSSLLLEPFARKNEDQKNMQKLNQKKNQAL